MSKPTILLLLCASLHAAIFGVSDKAHDNDIKQFYDDGIKHEEKRDFWIIVYGSWENGNGPNNLYANWDSSRDRWRFLPAREDPETIVDRYVLQAFYVRPDNTYLVLSRKSASQRPEWAVWGPNRWTQHVLYERKRVEQHEHDAGSGKIPPESQAPAK